MRSGKCCVATVIPVIEIYDSPCIAADCPVIAQEEAFESSILDVGFLLFCNNGTQIFPPVNHPALFFRNESIQHSKKRVIRTNSLVSFSRSNQQFVIRCQRVNLRKFRQIDTGNKILRADKPNQ